MLNISEFAVPHWLFNYTESRSEDSAQTKKLFSWYAGGVLPGTIPPVYFRLPFLEQLTETIFSVSLSKARLAGLIVHFFLAGVFLMDTL